MTKHSKYSKEVTSTDDKTMPDLTIDSVPATAVTRLTEEEMIEKNIRAQTAYDGPSTVRGTYINKVVEKKDKITHHQSVVNIEDYTISDVAFRTRGPLPIVLPFQIDGRQNLISYDQGYMPYPPSRTTESLANYGRIIHNNTVTHKMMPTLKPSLEQCANACAAANKQTFPNFESNCDGFEFNPHTNSCYGFSSKDVIANKSPRRGKVYYMGEILPFGTVSFLKKSNPEVSK